MLHKKISKINLALETPGKFIITKLSICIISTDEDLSLRIKALQ